MTDLTLKDFMPKPETGNVILLLNEIRHALRHLAETGEPTTIDLSGIPMTKAETEEFEAALGTGEVHAEIDAGGPSEVIETSFAGVWRVIHRASEEMTLARYIEVTRIPEILVAHPSDMRAALTRLEARLELSSEEEAL
ncbi:hydrogenase expression/formation protein [Celeribacter litoreus]|uniref:hydrogenase expression/formation protein n=1 Tax=Celeribacter litoreus TaxID=2876714 RepID=UPI001CCAAAFC|nr:hydrogenase expression/formation protein [Celeribacter litoreus]MCA0044374.1 hydrogenase expression/formation protein [Celeribacter litoreus]